MGSFLSNLFAPKEGGTVVGNIIRSAGTLISGGSATVQPQTTVPQQQMTYSPQPVMVAPQSTNNTSMLMIGAGVAVIIIHSFSGCGLNLNSFTVIPLHNEMDKSLEGSTYRKF